MSARSTAKKTPQAASHSDGTPISGPLLIPGLTAVHLGFYAVGLRISQLLMLDDLAEQDVARQSLSASDNLMIRQGYSFLTTAFERLAQALGLRREVAQRGHAMITEGSNAWKTSAKEDVDNFGNTALCLGELESLIRDISTTLGAAGAKARDWFELGLMVAEGEGDASVPYEQRHWTWHDAKGVDRRLKTLGLQRKDVFPDAIDPKSGGGWMVLPGKFSGWNNIEIGLMKLTGVIDPEAYEKGSPLPQAECPVWNFDHGELWWGGQLIRRVRVMKHPSSIQRILDAFQAAGWTSRIDDPISRGKRPDHLRQIVLSLNEGLRGLRFHVQESGQAITWTRV